MQAWEEFLTVQEAELGKKTVDKWLRSLKVEKFDACNLHLQAKDSFQKAWFDEHIRGKLDSLLLNNNKKKIRVHLDLPEKNQFRKSSYSRYDRQTPFKLEFTPPNEKLTFDNFISFEENILSLKILSETVGYGAESPQLGVFNPIYIYGKSGSGKSHLLNSAAIALREHGYNVIYTSTETFTEHVVEAIRNGEMRQFREIYRKADALIIDNIQVLSRKSATQEELFHTFNTLHLDGKQILLGANCSPTELSLVEPRLVSRFEWGMVLPIEPLKGDHLNKLIENCCERLGLSLQDEATILILENFSRSAKRITTALETLTLRIHLQASEGKIYSVPLSASSTSRLISDLIEKERKGDLKPENIVQIVAQFYGITADDILGRSQSRECALPRRIAMHLCRSKLNLPFMRIGEYFSRDHSTVMASIKQIRNKIDTQDKEISGSVNSISKKLELSQN